MNRTFKNMLLTVAFLAMISVSTLAGPAELGEFGESKGFGCKAPAVQMVDDTNIFLSASNSVSTISAARVFEGCWTYWPAGPCRAIYRQNQSYSICGQCDDFGNPGSGGCSSISIQTLNRGYWCS